LKQIAPSYNGQRDFIEKKPYEMIMEVLRYHLPKGAAEFEYEHNSMGDRSLTQLGKDGYDIENLIKDLKNIINKGE